MRGLIMDIQIGRVVGYTTTYRADGATTTVWARVLKKGVETLIVEPYHGSRTPRCLIDASAVHTVMPSSY